MCLQWQFTDDFPPVCYVERLPHGERGLKGEEVMRGGGGMRLGSLSLHTMKQYSDWWVLEILEATKQLLCDLGPKPTMYIMR